MTNGKHRARWLADIISEVQRYHSKAREAPESAAVRQALSRLAEARQAALDSDPETKAQPEAQP
jgi:hypothetical protein